MYRRKPELTSLFAQGPKERQLQQERKNWLVRQVIMSPTVRPYIIRHGWRWQRTGILTTGDCTTVSYEDSKRVVRDMNTKKKKIPALRKRIHAHSWVCKQEKQIDGQGKPQNDQRVKAQLCFNLAVNGNHWIQECVCDSQDFLFIKLRWSRLKRNTVLRKRAQSFNSRALEVPFHCSTRCPGIQNCWENMHFLSIPLPFREILFFPFLQGLKQHSMAMSQKRNFPGQKPHYQVKT